jgi:hypothetical protein
MGGITKSLRVGDCNLDDGPGLQQIDIFHNVILLRGRVLHKRGCRLGSSFSSVAQELEDCACANSAYSLPCKKDIDHLKSREADHNGNHFFDLYKTWN